ncbi:MAG: radical SAM protein [Candidatus Omnitrophica bacterium]|nr:radical SAM protein [Candidatus Omnitrophota bacterium]
MKYCYGPVLSRRLGVSLGIDIVPAKKCSFDCVYCQIGSTTEKTLRRFAYVDASILKKEISGVFAEKPKIDYITLAGSGEPTLHKSLDKIIALLKKTSGYSVPVCVITNSSLLYRKTVRRELMNADLIIPSLDTVTPSIFKKLNRPPREITVKKIVGGLMKLRKEFTGKIWLEIMLVAGLNDTEVEAGRLKKAIDLIKPDKVQVNLPVRPPAAKIEVPSPGKVKRFVEVIGGDVQVVDNRIRITGASRIARKIEKGVIELLRRRPATHHELKNSFGLDINEINRAIQMLIKTRKIKEIEQYGKKYFRIND